MEVHIEVNSSFSIGISNGFKPIFFLSVYRLSLTIPVH